MQLRSALLKLGAFLNPRPCGACFACPAVPLLPLFARLTLLIIATSTENCNLEARGTSEAQPASGEHKARCRCCRRVLVVVRAQALMLAAGCGPPACGAHRRRHRLAGPCQSAFPTSSKHHAADEQVARTGGRRLTRRCPPAEAHQPQGGDARQPAAGHGAHAAQVRAKLAFRFAVQAGGWRQVRWRAWRLRAATQEHTSWLSRRAVAAPGRDLCSELHFCNGLAFTFVRKLGAGISFESGHGFVIRKVYTGGPRVAGCCRRSSTACRRRRCSSAALTGERGWGAFDPERAR